MPRSISSKSRKIECIAIYNEAKCKKRNLAAFTAFAAEVTVLAKRALHCEVCRFRVGENNDRLNLKKARQAENPPAAPFL